MIELNLSASQDEGVVCPCQESRKITIPRVLWRRGWDWVNATSPGTACPSSAAGIVSWVLIFPWLTPASLFLEDIASNRAARASPAAECTCCLGPGWLSCWEISALVLSGLSGGLEPRGSLEEAIDFDSCDSCLNRSMSSKSHCLCKGRRAEFEETAEGIIKREKLRPAFTSYFSEATEHGASEADSEIFQFFWCWPKILSEPNSERATINDHLSREETTGLWNIIYLRNSHQVKCQDLHFLSFAVLQLQRPRDGVQRAALNITPGNTPDLPDEGIYECQGRVAAKITRCKVHFSVKEPTWKFINNNLHLEEPFIWGAQWLPVVGKG